MEPEKLFMMEILENFRILMKDQHELAKMQIKLIRDNEKLQEEVNRLKTKEYEFEKRLEALDERTKNPSDWQKKDFVQSAEIEELSKRAEREAAKAKRALAEYMQESPETINRILGADEESNEGVEYRPSLD